MLFSNKLVDNVANEERQKMEGWAEATRLFVSVDNNSEYFDFLWQIIEQNENIPVIIVDDNDDFSLDIAFSEEDIFQKEQL